MDEDQIKSIIRTEITQLEQRIFHAIAKSTEPQLKIELCYPGNDPEWDNYRARLSTIAKILSGEDKTSSGF